jgi:SRSO17 transposase
VQVRLNYREPRITEREPGAPDSLIQRAPKSPMIASRRADKCKPLQVTRQYCGQLGKQDNCQVAVTPSLANRDASLPVAYRPYLPEDWATDQGLRGKAKIPEEIASQTKPQMALEQIKAARAAGLPEAVVLVDAGTAMTPSCEPRSPRWV